MSCCYVSYLCLLLDFASNYFTVALFHCKSCAFIRSKPHYCQTQWFHRFFVGWIIMLGRGGSLSLPRAVLSLGRSRTIAKHTGFTGFLWVGSSCWEEVAPFHCQELCFPYVEAALLPNTLLSEVFCGLAHHVGKRWLSFFARAVLSVRRSRTIAKHSGFRGFLLVGSSCWEEVALFHCKSFAFIKSKPRYCQTHWFQRFFVGWLIMLGRGDSLSLQELCFH